MRAVLCLLAASIPSVAGAVCLRSTGRVVGVAADGTFVYRADEIGGTYDYGDLNRASCPRVTLEVRRPDGTLRARYEHQLGFAGKYGCLPPERRWDVDGDLAGLPEPVGDAPFDAVEAQLTGALALTPPAPSSLPLELAGRDVRVNGALLARLPAVRADDDSEDHWSSVRKDPVVRWQVALREHPRSPLLFLERSYRGQHELCAAEVVDVAWLPRSRLDPRVPAAALEACLFDGGAACVDGIWSGGALPPPAAFAEVRELVVRPTARDVRHEQAARVEAGAYLLAELALRAGDEPLAALDVAADPVSRELALRAMIHFLGRARPAQRLAGMPAAIRLCTAALAAATPATELYALDCAAATDTSVPTAALVELALHGRTLAARRRASDLWHGRADFTPAMLRGLATLVDGATLGEDPTNARALVANVCQTLRERLGPGDAWAAPALEAGLRSLMGGRYPDDGTIGGCARAWLRVAERGRP
jgi:hypothetical protein